MIDQTLPDTGDSDDIAIIGMSGRFPGAQDVDEFWHNLREGIESITPFSDEELLKAGVSQAQLDDPQYVKAGAILGDIDLFDAAFFGFTPREAQIMDPQQRLFLECAWNALESAGYNSEKYEGAIGVYAGSAISSYLLNNLQPNTEVTEAVGGLQVLLGNDKDSLTTRVAYLLDLKGPSYTVQTYCSTSLVAVHMARQSLLDGECDIALAGGVLIMVPEKAGYEYQEGGIASPDGRCRAFDAKAQGSPLGNGVALVVLKRLEDALKDGDTIHAVIKGSATNNDGSLKVGFTAPGVRGQAAVITEAMANAGVEAEDISYIEAHGTATALGDAIELAALIKAFAGSTQKQRFCAIGSAKTNVGHLDRAAGVTGLIKTVLALKHQQIPPSLNYKEPNPQIDLYNSPFYVNTQLRSWQTAKGPRRAGVSAFGIGGTNAHVIVEEAPVVRSSPSPHAYHVLLLSARTETALATATSNLQTYLQQHPDANMADVAYTLQVGRKTFDHCRAIICSTQKDALHVLASRDATRFLSNTRYKIDQPLAFLFAGVGEQYPGMAQELYTQEEIFCTTVDRCCQILHNYLGFDLRSILFPMRMPENLPRLNGHAAQTGPDLRRLLKRGDPATPDALDHLAQTSLAQPAVFIIEYALAQLLLHWGIQPKAMIGYSLGEYVAACLAGVLTLEDALLLVAKRAQLIQDVPPGAMLAVPLSMGEVQPYLSEQISLAAVNTPRLCILAGTPDAIKLLEMQLSEQEIVSRRLQTTHAFHSHMLTALQSSVTTIACQIPLRPPQIPYISNVTGTWITDEQATDPTYWAQHMCQTVLMAQGLEQLLQHDTGVPILLEIGPGQALTSMVKQHPLYTHENHVLATSTLPSVYEQQSAGSFLMATLGKLWLAGVTIDWTRFWQGEYRLRIPLPTYPFERQSYWIDPPYLQKAKEKEPAALPSSGKKESIADWFYVPHWKQVPLRPKPSSKLQKQEILLIFSDQCGIGTQVQERIAPQCQQIVCVEPGTQFARLDTYHFTIRPGEHTDYSELVRTLSQSGLLPQKIVHLWNITTEEEVATEIDFFQAMQKRGFYSLLFLVQALSASAEVDTLALIVVANNMQAVSGNELLYPEKAPLLGGCTVIAQEYLNITCRSIDIELVAPGSHSHTDLIKNISDELFSASTDSTVAYRNQERWVQTYSPWKPATQSPPALRHHGVYLITGGLGGVGLLLAEHLARTVQARLILLGRSSLPARAQWDHWLESHEADESTSLKIQKLKMLEALGAEVLVLQADVANEEQMATAINQAQEQFGGIHAVIHAAGQTNDAAFGMLQDTNYQACEQHFQSKVYGVFVLEKLLRGLPLDFCILCSSLSSVLGGLGLVAYAAANRFMDAFVYKHNQTAADVPWLSVSWDTWGIKEKQHWSMGATLAEFTMTPQEGTAAFMYVLNAYGLPHIVESTGDLQARIRQWVQLDFIRDDEQEAVPAAPAPLIEVPLTLSAETSSSEYERKIAAAWQRVLGIQKISLHDNFFDLGGNSLSGLQVLARLRKEFQVQIPVVALFEAPTISALARYLLPAPQIVPDVERQELTQRRQQARQAVGQQDIAIIGMSGRFPGASTLEQFWQNQVDGVESITFFTQEELRAAGIDPELLQDPNYVMARPILEEIDLFDAPFFGYTPREAEATDPQHRLFLEHAWEALERAGYNPHSYDGLIGVFGGTNISNYLLRLLADPTLINSSGIYQDYIKVIGNDKDSLTTSVSYKLNLRGPSYAVQTFCSTSLVAVHLAAQSLHAGECDIALAGGVSIRVPVKAGHLYEEGGMESPDGHCRTFDAQARGSMFGDGVGIVVLKRLQDALQDGDCIQAVIKGSAINNDGSLKVSYTAPSVTGQAEVVIAALANAGVDAASISYIEAHGTATELGDPIEVASLTKAFRTQTTLIGQCAIGSIKTNVGHLDRAAGVSGLIRVVQALQHKQLPPILHFQSPNPNIDFESSPFYVNTQLQEWQTNGKPRRAGINSLGMGGTNAHVIVEEAPPQPLSSEGRDQQLIMLSAQTPSALEHMKSNLQMYLQQHPECKLADVAYTLQIGRRDFDHRCVLLCQQATEAINILENPASGRLWATHQTYRDRPIAFLFPGVGEQYAGMARELYEQEAIFRDTVDHCCRFLQSSMNLDLHAALFPAPSTAPAMSSSAAQNGFNLRALLDRDPTGSHTTTIDRLTDTAIAQPAVFIIEYALAQLLRQWGLEPKALIGYSLGEYVAACLAGVLTLDDALLLVAQRAQLIHQLSEGAMIALPLSEEEVQCYLDEHVSLATVNGPRLCILAGPLPAIEQLEDRLRRQEISFRRLETKHAFHSTMLSPLKEVVTALVRTISLHAPQIPYISNLTGTWISAAQATDAGYWAEHMCQTVQMYQGLEHLLHDGDVEQLLLEVGPGQSLTSMVKQHPACSRERLALVLPTLPAAYDHQSAQSYLHATLGKLWLAGVTINWAGFYHNERRQRLPLPTYPFERQRYWLEPHTGPQHGTPIYETLEAAQQGLKREELAHWFYLPVWKQCAPGKPFSKNTLLTDQECWVFFADELGLTSHLRAHLEQHQQYIVTVTAGNAFIQHTDNAYTIRAGMRDDYTTLLRTLQEQGKTPKKLVHCWMTTEMNDAWQDDFASTAPLLDLGFYSLLLLTQALGDSGIDTCDIAIVSNELHDVTGNERIVPAKAAAIGPCKVIPLEHPTITCRSIDIVLPHAESAQWKQLVHHLLSELTSPAADKLGLVALRGKHRWIQTFEPVSLPEQPAQDLPLRQGGVYLITGGLGGIGLAMAEHLARTTKGKLLLVARSDFPAQHKWAHLLTLHEETSSLGYKLRQLQALEALGAEVLVLQADVTDESQMQAVVQKAITTFGALHGVIHAAGLPGRGLIQLKTPEAAAHVLAPKVQGTLVLERVLRPYALDFLVLFSSITSATGGGPGQVDYCAANAFLDAYAHRHAAQHGMTLAINWGEWQWNAWEEGMKDYDGELQAFFKANRQKFGITFAEGTTAWQRLLTSGVAQMVVMTQDFRVLVEFSSSFNTVNILQRTRQTQQSSTKHPRPILGGSYVSPRNEMEHTIAAIWEDILGITPIGINDNFFELGGNSLIGIDVIVRLRKALDNKTLPAYALYEAPSVGAMAQFIDQSKTTNAIEERQERGEKRRASLKQRMRETRGMR